MATRRSGFSFCEGEEDNRFGPRYHSPEATLGETEPAILNSDADPDPDPVSAFSFSSSSIPNSNSLSSVSPLLQQGQGRRLRRLRTFLESLSAAARTRRTAGSGPAQPGQHRPSRSPSSSGWVRRVDLVRRGTIRRIQTITRPVRLLNHPITGTPPPLPPRSTRRSSWTPQLPQDPNSLVTDCPPPLPVRNPRRIAQILQPPRNLDLLVTESPPPFPTRFPREIPHPLESQNLNQSLTESPLLSPTSSDLRISRTFQLQQNLNLLRTESPPPLHPYRTRGISRSPGLRNLNQLFAESQPPLPTRDNQKITHSVRLPQDLGRRNSI
jgi:hypothetical protein